MINSLCELFLETGFLYVDWRMIVMWAIVCALFYLAVCKEFEPLLLIPIAFGALLANLPTEGVVNKPAGAVISPEAAIVKNVFVSKGDAVFVPRVVKHLPKTVGEIAAESGLPPDKAGRAVADYFEELADITSPEGRSDVFKKAKGIPDLLAVVSPFKERREHRRRPKNSKSISGGKSSCLARTTFSSGRRRRATSWKSRRRLATGSKTARQS